MSNQLSKEEILRKNIPNFNGNKTTFQVVHSSDLSFDFDKKILLSMEQYANQKQSGMKWVKASERLPEKRKEGERLNIKYKNKPEVIVSIGDNWYWLDSESVVFSTKYPVHRESWNVIEWLDESNQSDIDAVEFAEWKDDNYTKVLGGFIHRMGSIESSKRFSYEELYSLFKQSKQINR